MSDMPKLEILDSAEGGLVCDVDSGICTPGTTEVEEPAGQRE